MWQNELVIIVRHIIDDLDSSNYEFSDDRIEEAILVSAQMIKSQVDFQHNYKIEVDNRLLTPDPTTTPVGDEDKDYDFINLCCLKTGLFFLNSLIKTYSIKSIIIKDGMSMLDMRNVVTGLKVLYDDLNKKYDHAILQYQTFRSTGGKAILSPYSPGSYFSGYSFDERAGYFR